MNNIVILIGLLIEINENYLELKVDNLGKIKVFFNEIINSNELKLNAFTKIEGCLSYFNFPFPVVLANKIFQIDDSKIS